MDRKWNVMALSQHDSVDQGGNACSTKGDHRKSLLAPGEATRPLLSQTRCAGNPFGGGGGGPKDAWADTRTACRKRGGHLQEEGPGCFWIRIVSRLEIAFYQILFLVLVTWRHKHQENAPIRKTALKNTKKKWTSKAQNPSLVQKNVLCLFNDLLT